MIGRVGSGDLAIRRTTSFTYDHNGNTLTKTDSSGTTQYGWDYENRLTSVTLPNGGGMVSFTYDPFGRRIEKAGPSGTVIYAYDGANGIEEMDASGNVTARYIQGAGIDEPLAQSATALNFYEADGLGSITSLTDSAGTASEIYTYDAYGNLTGSAGNVANAYRYTGREYDQETGLYYYRARYYDPTAGRFLNEDPLQFNAGMNFYEYSYNNPANFNDPSGLQPAPAWVPPPPAAGGGLTLIQGGGGAAGGTGAGVGAATVGLVALDAGLLAYDSYQFYHLGIAYGWWKPFLDSGNMQQVKDPKRAKCQDGCPPCVPPVGSLRHRVDQVPPSRPHKPWPGTHWHVEQMHQAPAPACTCRWIEISNGQGPVPPGIPAAQ